MTRRWARLSVIATVVALTASPSATARQRSGSKPPAPSTGVVAGRVRFQSPFPSTAKRPDYVVLALDGSRMGRIGPPQQVLIGPGGRFTFSNVAPGFYHLTFNPYGMFQDLPIEVGPDGLTNIVLNFVAPSEVTVRLSMDDGSPLPAGGVDQSIAFAFGRGSQVVRGWARNGEIKIMALSGDHYLFLRPPAGYYIVSLKTSSGTDLAGGLLRIGAGAVPVSVRGVISRNAPPAVPGVSVTGRITTDHPNVEVALIDLSPFASPASRPAVARAVTGSDSSFTFRGIAPGFYAIDVPPAVLVRDAVVVGATDVTDVVLDMPQGQVFAGVLMAFVEINGQRQSRPAGAVTVRFVGEGIDRTMRVSSPFFWSALPPGEYRVSVEPLDPGSTLEVLRAGSVNLLTQPFVVLPDRNPETIGINLRLPATPDPFREGFGGVRPAPPGPTRR